MAVLDAISQSFVLDTCVVKKRLAPAMPGKTVLFFECRREAKGSCLILIISSSYMVGVITVSRFRGSRFGSSSVFVLFSLLAVGLAGPRADGDPPGVE
jgi:hypothetical protein